MLVTSVSSPTLHLYLFLRRTGGKLQPTNFSTILLGYDEQSKAYRLYDPLQRKIIVSHQVQILEQQPGDFGSFAQHILDVFSPLFDFEGEADLPPPAALPTAELADNPAAELLNNPAPIPHNDLVPIPNDNGDSNEDPYAAEPPAAPPLAPRYPTRISGRIRRPPFPLLSVGTSNTWTL